MVRTLPAALAIVLIAGPAAAQQFSADLVDAAGEGGSGKLYVSDGKVRMENASAPGRGTMVADTQANTAYVLMPAQKMYLDMSGSGRMTQIFTPIDPNNACPRLRELAQEAHKDAGEWTCKRVGGEALNGRSTVKYQAGTPQGQTYLAWIDTNLKFMVKTQDPTGKGMELRNIKEGAQPASLFELPADYRKLDMSQMQQMLQQRGGAKP